MTKGTVLFHREFTFRDGEIGEKYLIILNTPQHDEPYLCCKTTSKCQKHGITTEGCHPHKNIYMLRANHDWFPHDTCIQFHELYEIKMSEFLKAKLQDNTCEIKHCLRDETSGAIRNCIKKSDDVSEYHLELIFKS
ncbi:MAG: hypothetical protein Q7U68_04075 [Candidatus Roizmanbacteria bacterium]|nr:hypothetical protein [Candidatus Roizmanbacteria bacterium]